MNTGLITPATSQLFKFYSHCFAYPYEEMNYELQNLFRVLESEDLNDEEIILSDQVLSIINLYQGEEIKDLRNEFVSLFTAIESEDPICPIIASDFCKLAARPYDAFEAEEYIYDSAIPVSSDDPIDSIVNYLMYLAYACDEFLSGESEVLLSSFFDNHIIYWIPNFCDRMHTTASLSFYKEVAVGLKETILLFGQDN